MNLDPDGSEPFRVVAPGVSEALDNFRFTPRKPNSKGGEISTGIEGEGPVTLDLLGPSPDECGREEVP